ncbi:predicted protein [Scheffersomyces stipitis CBS 6054]|uniref:Uncharacterized protein n=1 Tax=Scheffersomyces stipitis (strain ATCC 58785 / CBS 6054 / NBRC 10063 / NRRL Y-11545) TaxID=322104 RepID=A3LZ52_PICST|nr:predicted protein [Scheffersomyces stipitis CBS 6054]ABN68279.2 predicted protein [Scheffersomyces stipitis CBS 6054]KAG2734249.1 hypothetical protein G9P44_002255 [Scheffersomyces stipitis]
MTIIRRLLSTSNWKPPESYFSHSPLNYESYSRRLKGAIHYIAQNGRFTESILIDCIRANRQLQQQNWNSSPIIQKTRSRNDFLNLKLSPSNSTLEDELFSFVFNRHQERSSSPEIVRSYLITEPLPSNTARVIDVGVKGFEYSFLKQKVEPSLVFTALRLLLDRKDYQNSFKLIDSTFNCDAYKELQRHQIGRNLFGWFSYIAVATVVQAILFPLVSILALFSVNTATAGILMYGLLRLDTAENLGRISWRPYVSMLYKFTHRDELLAINTVITHFEEHNEVNIKNYHHSRVRKLSNLKLFDQDEYVLELPNDSVELASVEYSGQTFQEEKGIVELQQYFKHELNSRKMVFNDLPEELIFLEFWFTHGENFEWVEPDQDPAEIIKLDIQNQKTD